MIITDLTVFYIEAMLNDNNLKAYEKSYPALFSHYFKYWGNRKSFRSLLSANEAEQRNKLVRNGISCIEKELKQSGLNFAETEIVLFAGQGLSNGHAFRNNGRFIVWIPIEGYKTALQAKIFVTHELMHSLHYTCRPEFYFNNCKEKRSVARQLITEGLATYLTMKILRTDEGTALWADYIQRGEIRKWLKSCGTEERTLYLTLLKKFNSSGRETGLFYAGDPKDIMNFRAGYYAGLKLVEEIAERTGSGVPDLLRLPRGKFEKMMQALLRRKVR